MESLIIKETTSTPKVVLDSRNNNFEFQGCSRPEDVRNFYMPIINWLEKFRDTKAAIEVEKHATNPIIFKFKLDYFNSSSAKFILDILVLINQLHLNGINLKIDWFYNQNDDDMLEVGKELSEVVDFPFEYIEVKKQVSG
ncbi:MAG: DUF1987 domain-containing protein [Salinivirgaceae bacterium]